MDRGQVSHLDKGRWTLVHPMQLQKLAALLHTTTDYLLWVSDDAQPSENHATDPHTERIDSTRRLLDTLRRRTA
jgi:hypothetical protein